MSGGKVVQLEPKTTTERRIDNFFNDLLPVLRKHNCNIIGSSNNLRLIFMGSELDLTVEPPNVTFYVTYPDPELPPGLNGPWKAIYQISHSKQFTQES